MSPTLQTLLPVAAGIAVVVLGILVFRLHAFFALLLAAAVTAALTPDIARQRYEYQQQGAPWNTIGEPQAGYIRINDRLGRLVFLRRLTAVDADVYESDELRVFTPADMHQRGTLFRDEENAREMSTQDYPAYAYVPFDSESLQLEKDDLLLTPTQTEEADSAASRPVSARIASAFGDTVGSIGLLIAFASVIGMCLLDSGAADRIVRSALRLVGERGAPLAFASCGFLLGVPVFFDTVFLLMIPLGKALRLRTGRDYVLYVLTIVCGATMAHSLVPPTPGPLLVAEALNVDMGTMILVGTAVGLIVSAYGLVHATIANRFFDVPLRDTPEMPLADLERLAAKPDHELPPLWASLLPIVLPVWLIGQQAALQLLLKDPPAALGKHVAHIPAWLVTATDTLGEKNVAVGIGVVIALILLVRQSRQTLGQLRDRIGAALASGGSIILITAAGGAFGKMIEQTGVSSLLKEMPALGPAGLLSLAFLVTTAIRTAQGSSTVAMITAVGIFSGVELPFHPVWLALSIGCGSKPFSWMTDSGFWVICKMSGMTEAETLKSLTPMTAMMGLVGLATVIAGATVFPMK